MYLDPFPVEPDIPVCKLVNESHKTRYHCVQPILWVGNKRHKLNNFAIVALSPVVDTGGQLVAMATPVSYAGGVSITVSPYWRAAQHMETVRCALVAKLG